MSDVDMQVTIKKRFIDIDKLRLIAYLCHQQIS